MHTTNVDLFGNERESNAASSVAMIEDVLRELGHDPETTRTASGASENTWIVARGSAAVIIELSNRDDYVYLRVVAPVLTVNADVDTGRLYARLLELNARQVTGAAFALEGAEVQLLNERSTIDLDRSEVIDVIGRVSKFADEWDEKLVGEFGGTPGRAG